MKYQILSLLRFSVLLLFFEFSTLGDAMAQCPYARVEHTNQTQTVGCSDVTVTSAGAVASNYDPICGYGPFRIALWTNGSYTFDFSPPVSGIRINVMALNNQPGASEEMVVYINGAFYPITIPGAPDGCQDPAMISPSGTIVADPLYVSGSWQDIDIYENISTLTIECNIIEGSPGGFTASLYLCCLSCETDAGQIASGPLWPCIDGTATAPPATQTNLDGDDILQYILFSNPTDPTGSVLATNNDPSFNFDPSLMVPGSTYYLAAIAGNELNSGIDPNDPCLSISNPVAVTWHAKPTVTLSAIEQCLTPNNCYNIGLQFTGNPPFQLGGEVVSNGNVITTFTGTFGTYFSAVNICLPAYTPIGPIDINVTSLSDAYCNCN